MNVISNNIYWNFNEIKKRLYTKLNYLAIVKAYPYRKDKIYYKYTSIEIYKLKGFDELINLIENDKVFML